MSIIGKGIRVRTETFKLVILFEHEFLLSCGTRAREREFQFYLFYLEDWFDMSLERQLVLKVNGQKD